MPKHYDVITIGAGSSGIGAALSAARLGASVLLVEQADMIGGTASRGGVHCWEPGVGGTGLPYDIYRRLKRIPNAAGIYSYHRHGCWPGPDEPYKFPGGLHRIDETRRYRDTLRRHGLRSLAQNEAFAREHLHGVVFEPDAYCDVVETMLADTGRCTLLKRTTFADLTMAGSRIESLMLHTGDTVTAGAYVDATGDMALAAAAGCEVMIGQDGRGAFDEPSAPDEPNARLNGVSLIYRVSPTDEPGIEPLPKGIPEACWWRDRFPGACMNTYPCGDRNVNLLPTMDGREAFEMGLDAAYAECKRRILAHWHWLQATYDEFRSFRLTWVAPMLGVRESRRIRGRYVLTERDLRAGLSGQRREDIIAIADHAMDTHGAATCRAGCGELDEPYGIPYGCLLPLRVDNLLVAGRGASFSSLAASSCRLSRTMMHLGQAAGTAAAIAKARGCALVDLRSDELRDALKRQHVQLEHPMPSDLAAHLDE